MRTIDEAFKGLSKQFKETRHELKEEVISFYSSLFSPEKYEKALSILFFLRMGYRLDLKNPKAFEEKIQWLKLYDNIPEKTRLADKYCVREYVKERIGEEYLIPLLGVYDSFEEIDLSSLPQRFVMKTNHGCGYNIVVDDKRKFNEEAARKKFHKWLSVNYAWRNGFELQYRDIQPKLLVEENISEQGEDLKDYKIWCMDGKPTYIFVITGRKGKSTTMAFFNKDWELQPFINSTKYKRCTEEIPKPDKLDEMLKLAEKLSEGFCFVRVDLYNTPHGIKFGEMTFTPSSGLFKWNPPEYGRICGELIHLPCEK